MKDILHKVHGSDAVNCDRYKYSVQHPHQPDYCITCRICSIPFNEKYLNTACKQKNPESIPGQGDAWCMGSRERSPWCPNVTVNYGRLTCTSANDVYSNCTLECHKGYMPIHGNWTELQCLESLHWSIPNLSNFGCQRSAKPDKPVITSIDQKYEVKAGSDKTLTCELSSDALGRHKIYWYFNGKLLYSDSDVNTYTIHRFSLKDEGTYFCQVEDQLGKSDLSAGYLLKVQESFTDFGHGDLGGIIAGVALGLVGLLILVFIAKKYHKCIRHGHWSSSCQSQNGEKIIDSCLSSVTFTDGFPGASAVFSSSDSESGDPESKQLHVNQMDERVQRPAQECHLLFECEGSSNGTNIIDQQNLREVFKSSELMKKLKTHLDQACDPNKPTFHSLGTHLGECPNTIANFEFCCCQRQSSPTEGYIKKMIEEGQGLSNLLNFLRKYGSTKKIANDIETLILLKK